MDIHLNHISKKYGDRIILNDVTIKIPSGKIYGFIGANGAGKTTTMKILTGLLPATKGSVCFDGVSFKDLKEQESIFGAFISTPSYYKNLTAYENLAIIQDVLKKPKKEIDRVLNLVGLSEARNKVVSSFSFGMKQRLGLAFAFLNNPDILVLDEPTNGLDPKGIVEIRELLYRLAKEEGKTIFISSHHISEIETIADMVGIIHDGELIFEGTLSELYNKRDSSYHLEVLNPDVLESILQGRNISFVRKESHFEIKASKQDIPVLIKEIVQEGANLLEASPNKNLETIFLDLTKGDRVYDLTDKK
ncbi:ATP-binding cassette domain-containing protein [Streptococcus pluranimalium]|uniref:ATP-binding cassette domain-containing protein n=1 Tax=Streptococcus pluranimalium TaxID=82348 RepID=UPI0039FB9D90